jgi:hypothetical protein
VFLVAEIKKSKDFKVQTNIRKLKKIAKIKSVFGKDKKLFSEPDTEYLETFDRRIE